MNCPLSRDIKLRVIGFHRLIVYSAMVSNIVSIVTTYVVLSQFYPFLI